MFSLLLSKLTEATEQNFKKPKPWFYFLLKLYKALATVDFTCSRMTSLDNYFKARAECFMYCKGIGREFRPSAIPNLLWHGSLSVLKCILKILVREKV